MIDETVITVDDPTLVVACLTMGNRRRLARGAGLTSGFTSRVFSGKRGTSIVTAKRIADAAGVTLDDLYWYIYQRNNDQRLPRTRVTLKEMVIVEAESRSRARAKKAAFNARVKRLRGRGATG